MRRIEKLEKIVSEDHFHKREWARLTAREREDVREFILKHEALDYNEFAKLAARLGLSSYKDEIPQRAHFKEVCQILSVMHKTVPGFYGYEG